MITGEQLAAHLERRPFAPFRVVLKNGELLDIVRIAQAVATRTQFSVVTPEDRMRHISVNDVDHVEVFESKRAG